MEHNDRSDGQQYLDEVTAELRRREGRLGELDMLIASLEFELRQSGMVQGAAAGALLGGNAGAIRAVEAYRKVKRKELNLFRTERQSVLEDIRRAQERRQMIEDELGQ